MALVVALCGLATAGPAMAATQQPVAAASTGAQELAPAIPTGFVDLPTSALPADDEPHEFTVIYRNDSRADRTVAPQLLVTSPDAGPFQDPADVKLERRTAHGCWKPVQLGTQSGALFTDLTTARRPLHSGETLTQVYRLTVVDPEAEGTVAPRVALYG
ncbi:signal peptide protein [Streptomyces bicolor]|uniref:signal peptide protein n=1 Tax=Streptomyces bicolor TaxID=66874 RepID=UPI000A55A824|nr:signal peptide protein [Streptomyces bicolor]